MRGLRHFAVVFLIVSVLFTCIFLRISTNCHFTIVHDCAKVTSLKHDIIDACLTIDWSNPRYCTLVGRKTLSFGNHFNVSPQLLKDLEIPLKEFAPMERKSLNDFVFATAADEAYLHVAMDAIGIIQMLLPNHTIYFYDLNSTRLPEHVRKIKNLCKIVYRKFNYSRYPEHVQHLKNYAFKPLIVHEMLAEFPRVFWIDSSTRFLTGDLRLTLDDIFTSGGIITFDETGHSNYAATHEGMYRFLPMPAAEAKTTVQMGANVVYFQRTEHIYNRIVVWWVLCALKEECMAAGHELKCHFRGYENWGGCHRFDQAAVNILMANYFNYDVRRYKSQHGQLEVKRHIAHQKSVFVCPARNTVKSAEYFT